MAYPKTTHGWQANRFYAIGDVVRPPIREDSNAVLLPGQISNDSNTLAFKCVTAGTSGENEPTFPRQITKTVDDSGVLWEAFEPLAEELQKLAPTAIIDLFEVTLTSKINGVDSILRYHAGKNGITENITFGGETYPAVPVEVDGFEFSAKGTLPRPSLRVANVNNAITSLIVQYDLLAAKVERIRTFAKFIDTANYGETTSFAAESSVEDIFVTQGSDTLIMQTFSDTSDPDAKTVETWYVDRIATESLEFVEFELTPKLDLTNLALPRRTIEEFCPWRYRGTECGYTDDACFTIDDVATSDASKDVCGKRVSSCQARFGLKQDLPFGGFYGARLQA